MTEETKQEAPQKYIGAPNIDNETRVSRFTEKLVEGLRYNEIEVYQARSSLETPESDSEEAQTALIQIAVMPQPIITRIVLDDILALAQDEVTFEDEAYMLSVVYRDIVNKTVTLAQHIFKQNQDFPSSEELSSRMDQQVEMLKQQDNSYKESDNSQQSEE